MSVGPTVIEVVAGEARVLTLSPATATDVTGWTFAFRAAAKYGDAATITKTVALGDLAVADAAAGTVEVTLTAADTDTAAEFVWELLRTDSGSEAVLAWGKLVIVAGIDA